MACKQSGAKYNRSSYINLIEDNGSHVAQIEIFLIKNRISANDTLSIFRKVDKSKDNLINEKELKTALKELGLSPVSDKLIKCTMETFDKDKSGALNFEEFQALVNQVEQAKGQLSSKMRDIFHTIDENGDGSLTPDELKSGLAAMGNHMDDRVIDSMIKAADTDNDGRVNYEEFIKVMSG
ncbi:TNNC2 [Branchiostoma lanceolatum]|uniref:TNNC2 protein n=1 Tax=Branchiostoma lanceolatum TaxID=7740 RepID=A0A8J9YZW7_BRALA|nr:TNNC2 [Branchiostoma lanceolatum]